MYLTTVASKAFGRPEQPRHLAGMRGGQASGRMHGEELVGVGSQASQATRSVVTLQGPGEKEPVEEGKGAVRPDNRAVIGGAVGSDGNTRNGGV